MSGYHPNAVIDGEIAADALAAERADLTAGYPPRRWTCSCGASHSRGHFMSIGVHRCLRCGYVGAGGVMWGTMRDTEPESAAPRGEAHKQESPSVRDVTGEGER